MDDKKQQEGTDQIIKVIDVIVEGANVAPIVREEKRIIGKVMALLPLTDEVAALITLKPKMLKMEIEDLSKDEINILVDHIKEKYDVPDDNAEAAIEAGLEIISDGFEWFESAYVWAKGFFKKD